MTEDQFDQWVFGAPRNSRAGRNKLDSLLTLEVDEVCRTCGLSEVQKKKLVLAGRGDIKRFFDKVEENTHGFQHTTRRTFAEQANLAINQTFMRSINTSLIGVLPVVALMVVAIASVLWPTKAVAMRAAA